MHLHVSLSSKVCDLQTVELLDEQFEIIVGSS